VTVTAGGKELSQQLVEVTLEPGKQYSVSIVVNKEESRSSSPAKSRTGPTAVRSTGDRPVLRGEAGGRLFHL
jgi:hypothetical protein